MRWQSGRGLLFQWMICAALLSAGDALAAEQDKEAGSSPVLAQLTGVVCWADGRPLVQTEVKLHRWGGDWRGWLPAERVADVSGNGTFSFENVPSDRTWKLVVREPGAGLSLRHFRAGSTMDQVRVTLRPPVASYVTVRDERGRPLAGAAIRSWHVVDGSEGHFGILLQDAAELGLPHSVSDDFGRLFLPELPEGVVLDLIQIEHPEHLAAVLRPNVALQAGEIASCRLPSGFPLNFHIVEAGSARPPQDLSEVMVLLSGNESNANEGMEVSFPNNVINIVVPVQEGRAELRLRPDEFNRFVVESRHHYLTPQVWVERLRFAEDQHDEWTLRASPKVPVRGRVVKADGTPMANAEIWGEIENVMGDGSPVPTEWSAWVFAEQTMTDEHGEYCIHLTPGRNRIRYRGTGVPSVDLLPVTIRATAEQRVPEIIVGELPKIRGTVYGQDGRPAPGAVVRLFSESVLGNVLPVLTDDQGHFEFTLPSMPHSFKSEERVYLRQIIESEHRVHEHQLFAYLPHDSVGGMTTIDLLDEDAVGAVTIHMVERPVDWPLSEMRPAFTRWERGESQERWPLERIKPENAAGATVPPLDGSLWLNTDKGSLADFGGHYVLLDFYTTWCGWCVRDLPTLKLIDLLFHDRISVVGVHDNSSEHDVIREHAAQHGMEMPIVVDHDDGRIVKAYESTCLIYGYPSYVLLDPEGRLLTADACTSGPSLRFYKIELVRQFLLQDAGRKSRGTIE